MEVSEVKSRFKSLLLSIGNSPEKEVIKIYADLDIADRNIVRDFYVAQRQGNPVKYGAARRSLIWRVGELVNRLHNSPSGSEEKLKLLARLINLHGILRENNISASEVRSIIKYRDFHIDIRPPMSLHVGSGNPVEVTPSGLKEMAERGDKTAQEFMVLLSIEKERGYSYFQYLKDNIRSIIFLPSQKAYLKAFPSSEWRGSEEELSRHVIADTYCEKYNEPREIWNICGILIHEAAHIEYYHDPVNAKDPDSLKTISYENNAYTTQIRFLNDLLKAAGDPRNKMSLNKELLRQIQKNIAIIEEKIKKRDFNLDN